MKTRGKTLAWRALFQCRIYFIFSAVTFHCLYLNASFCQEIGAYRTVASGNFGNLGIWEVYNGLVWVPATAKPNLGNDIYINQNHKVTLTANEEAKSLFINSETGAGEKLNLNGRNINLYGSLQAFSGAAPGIPSGTWNSQNWIGNSIASTITFKGSTRIITPKNAWSGFTTQSRYTVIFDPGAGNTLTIEEPFKAVKFILRSGILRQKLDISVVPNFCSSISFNTETSFYPSGPFGDFIIESGGIFISECSDNVIARSISGSVSANLFDLQSGAELILEGSSPKIEAATFQLNGKVTFRKNSGTQDFLSKSYASSAVPLTFHDLEIQGSQNVTLPNTLSLNGDMTQVGSGAFVLINTELNLIGSTDQHIIGFAMNVNKLTVNKPAGTAFFAQNLAIRHTLKMDAGGLNLQGNNLTLNTLGSGGLVYSAGHWINIGQFTYQNTPSSMTSINATFPFYDQYQGGIRKVQMLGTSAGGHLNIQFTEYKGADFNPSFNDLDGTPILYRLFSYFNFSGLNASSNPLELRISAEKLIVDEPEDLRLVCTGYAAPGTHIESSDRVNLWAIRSLTFDDLTGKNFTVGSFRTLSILPVTWLSISANIKNNIKQVSWSVAEEKDNEKFEIYSSNNPLNDWIKIGEIHSQGDSDTPALYSFTDENLSKSSSTYYLIRLINFSGQEFWSKVVRLENDTSTSKDQVTISPNPHFSGKISVSLPESFNLENSQISVYSIQGLLISDFKYHEILLSEKLEVLNPGIYLIKFSNQENTIQSRWIKH
ncbi:T9SS type A sorting domain-containing protein [Algoriphagus aquimarinus]|uniref:Por secretion system C-terminal sorting domain-containing protein n=1 Tax=Algoriphagus aquimarinus TaxID=237018 RepID=A0A1I0WWH3_9BACT|nr:T9SS type A sorting domain-containing protein [Algoriphagus aquimarinus]SFA93142.1 Por secretion system C-terminal sorting domain-containing protein [Algoriphagus aquimarinus]